MLTLYRFWLNTENDHLWALQATIYLLKVIILQSSLPVFWLLVLWLQSWHFCSVCHVTRFIYCANRAFSLLQQVFCVWCNECCTTSKQMWHTHTYDTVTLLFSLNLSTHLFAFLKSVFWYCLCVTCWKWEISIILLCPQMFLFFINQNEIAVMKLLMKLLMKLMCSAIVPQAPCAKVAGVFTLIDQRYLSVTASDWLNVINLNTDTHRLNFLSEPVPFQPWTWKVFCLTTVGVGELEC